MATATATNKKIDYSRYGLLFVAPYFIAFCVFGLYPILYSLYLSFTKWNGFGHPVWVGLANYARLVSNPSFYHSVANTFIIWIISIVPQLILALVLALILNERFIKGRHLLRAIYFFPNIVTPVTVGVLASLMFGGRTGSVDKILVALHILNHPINWFGHPLLAQIIVAGIMCWQWFGFNMLIFTAGLQSIPRTLYEAAEIDGAGKVRVAWNITIPLLRPVMIFTIVTSIIGGLQIFAVPMMLGNVSGNAVNTMVTYLYNTAYTNFQYGYGASVAYGIFMLIVIFSVVSFMVSTRNRSITQG